jgi:3-phenylpropionate/cinnamic acid dioxygenase small subunit
VLAPETQITNLLYTYAELIDTGDLEGAAHLFDHARVKMLTVDDGDGTVDAAELLATWHRFIVLYPDGTPRTKHVITNPIVEVDDAAGTARCRSYYTVFQQLDGFPLQPVIAGRYDDRFERVDGAWRWSYRDYSLIDLVGDMSHHAAQPIPAP